MGSNATEVSILTEEPTLHKELNMENEDATILLLGAANETNMTTLMDPTTMSSVEADIQILKKNIDVFFLIIMGIIVFLMQAGFAFLEAGSVRSKNTTNIILKNVLDCFISGIVYWIIGYPLAYGEGNVFLGHTGWASYGLSGTDYALWFFQFVFAAATSTIVSGAMAERCTFGAYLFYSAVLSGFLYPVVSHWAWASSGWLANTYYHDFAGSGVVHLTGGIAGLVGCVCLGPRIGRFDGEKPQRIEGHSLPLAALGGFILLFGFLAFNGGSQLAISGEGDAEVVATSIINTVISGSAAALSVLLIRRFPNFSRPDGSWSFALTLNGALTGMVSACAGCNVMHPWGSFIMGIFAGPIYLLISMVLEVLKVDDPLDAVAVHAGGGIWGLIAVSFFKSDGILFAGKHSGETLGYNIAGAICITAWTAAISGLMFGTMKYKGWLRVSKMVELKGLDLAKHGEAAYPAIAWNEDQYTHHNNNNNNDISPDLAKHEEATNPAKALHEEDYIRNNNDMNLPPVMCANTSGSGSRQSQALFRELKEQVSLKGIKTIMSPRQTNTSEYLASTTETLASNSISFVNEGYKLDNDNENTQEETTGSISYVKFLP